ncbi:hypothetical protein B5G00_18535 [Blautia sp. An46]|nr:hypothetical protein B5G00_18535 [Blautia sp. An46]
MITYLLFKDPPSGLTLHRDSDKEIKYVVVALPELIDKDRFFPEGEVAIQAAPLTHAFPAVTDHLGRDMGKQPVYSLAIVRDAHVSAGGFAGRYLRIRQCIFRVVRAGRTVDIFVSLQFPEDAVLGEVLMVVEIKGIGKVSAPEAHGFREMVLQVDRFQVKHGQFF